MTSPTSNNSRSPSQERPTGENARANRPESPITVITRGASTQNTPTASGENTPNTREMLTQRFERLMRARGVPPEALNQPTTPRTPQQLDELGRRFDAVMNRGQFPPRSDSLPQRSHLRRASSVPSLAHSVSTISDDDISMRNVELSPSTPLFDQLADNLRTIARARDFLRLIAGMNLATLPSRVGELAEWARSITQDTPRNQT